MNFFPHNYLLSWIAWISPNFARNWNWLKHISIGFQSIGNFWVMEDWTQFRTEKKASSEHPCFPHSQPVRQREFTMGFLVSQWTIDYNGVYIDELKTDFNIIFQYEQLPAFFRSVEILVTRAFECVMLMVRFLADSTYTCFEGERTRVKPYQAGDLGKIHRSP